MMNPNILWKTPCANTVPQVTVQAIPHDGNGNILVMHRSAKVRSAPDCWSFPSGLHDIGETLEFGMTRELREEYELQTVALQHLGVYENIAGDGLGLGEQYHWVVVMMMAGVSNLHQAVNKEPDKHDAMEFVPAEMLVHSGWRAGHLFHPSLNVWLDRNGQAVVDQLLLSPCLHHYTVNDEEHMLEICQGCLAERDITGGAWSSAWKGGV